MIKSLDHVVITTRALDQCIAFYTGVLGMWLERFIIVVPTLANPRLHYAPQVYLPSWVEVGETVGCFSLFILLYLVFTKFFPIVSIWEIQEGRSRGVQETVERVRSYLPEMERGAIPSGGTARGLEPREVPL